MFINFELVSATDLFCFGAMFLCLQGAASPVILPPRVPAQEECI